MIFSARSARRQSDRLRSEIAAASQARRQHEYLLTAGQTVGGIKEVLPIAEIMRQLMTEAKATLSTVSAIGAEPVRRSRMATVKV